MDIPINRNNSDSWRTYKNLYPKNGMLLQHWGVGHAQFAWDLRMNTKIIDIFAQIWAVERDNLFVSFDGSSFSFPPEITNFGWKTKNKIKLHCDQSFLHNEFKCVQSWIGANDTNNGDATLCILEGSHNYHHNFKENFNSLTDNELKNNWFILTNEHINWYIEEKNCPLQYIKCQKGSLVLWDSRLIHCGSEPMKNRTEPNMRIVSYLSYLPKCMSTRRNNDKRLDAYNELRTTAHWANNIKMFPKIPRTFGNPIPNICNINSPILNDIGFNLI